MNHLSKDLRGQGLGNQGVRGTCGWPVAGQGQNLCYRRSRALIRYESEKTLDKIRMQETAQMAAWVAQDPPVLKKPNTKFRRLLVSQDHGEVYLIIATFDYQYVEYICALGTGSRGKGSTHPFLEMREYGTFEVKSPEQMEQLGIILLGASIQGGLWDMFQLRLYHHGVS